MSGKSAMRSRDASIWSVFCTTGVTPSRGRTLSTIARFFGAGTAGFVITFQRPAWPVKSSADAASSCSTTTGSASASATSSRARA